MTHRIKPWRCLALVLVLSGAGLTLYAAGCGRRTPEAPEPIARRGIPIVEAMRSYQRTHGLWPYELGELSPAYLPPGATAGWVYQWHAEGYWKLICYAGLPDWAVQYTPKGNTPGWAVVVDGVYDIPLDVEQPPTRPDAADGEASKRARREELERRVAADPRQVVHYKPLFAAYLDAGDPTSARALCERCLAHRPDHWWPHLALAEAEARCGNPSGAAARLRVWARDGDDLPRNCLLAEFLHRHVGADAARDELRRCAGRPLAHLYPINAAESLGYGASAFAWRAAMWAYRDGMYDVALALCDRWEEAEKEHHLGGHGYLAVRAACRLATGDAAGASAQLRLVSQRCPGNYGWNQRLDKLQAAIILNDRAFRYDPGELGEYPTLSTPYQ